MNNKNKKTNLTKLDKILFLMKLKNMKKGKIRFEYVQSVSFYFKNNNYIFKYYIRK